ncbi:hypothetical protein V7139_16250 [Neobacillus drentensis]|uniref:hypothetical protein n=1 Tax=Bacillus sp. X1(2014) TaxID=1565991 RepID=UPI0011A8D09C|nr:hypothetical protein [Bacillus sp. X1(2014)]
MQTRRQGRLDLFYVDITYWPDIPSSVWYPLSVCSVLVCICHWHLSLPGHFDELWFSSNIVYLSGVVIIGFLLSLFMAPETKNMSLTESSSINKGTTRRPESILIGKAVK